MNDDHEARIWQGLRDHLDELGQLAPSPDVDKILERSRRRRPLGAAFPAGATAVVAVGILIAALSGRSALPSTSGGANPTPTPAIDSTDLRFAGCGGAGASVQAAFPLAVAREYKLHLPNMLRSPELDESSSPAFVVVFVGPWPGVVEGAPGPVGGESSTSDALASAAVAGDGVCVWVGEPGVGQPIIYSNVDTSGLTP